MTDDNMTGIESAITPTEEDLGPAVQMLVAGWKVFGRYTLEARVGFGGMSVVWRAHDEVLDEAVALKFVAEIVARDALAVGDLRERTARARWLAHPHIVRMNDFMRDNAVATISMEYVEGATLEQRRLERPGGVFSTVALAPLIEQICPALDYAHQAARIVHRSLKPSNILVTADGVVKITNFGIAWTLDEEYLRLGGRKERFRRTMAFLSPQQLDGNPPSPADDIYALGATFYQLLAGAPPFSGGDVESQIRTQEPVAMAVRRAQFGMAGEPIPQAWEDAVAACLAKEPGQRPSCGEGIMCLLELGGRSPAAGSRSPVPAARAGDPAPQPSSVMEAGSAPGFPGAAPAIEKVAPVIEEMSPVEEPAPAPAPPVVAEPESVAVSAAVAPVIEEMSPVEEPAPAPAPPVVAEPESVAVSAAVAPVIEEKSPVEEPAPASAPPVAPGPESVAVSAAVAPVIEEKSPVEEPAPASAPPVAPGPESVAVSAAVAPVIEEKSPVEEPAPASAPPVAPGPESVAVSAAVAPVIDEKSPVEEPAPAPPVAPGPESVAVSAAVAPVIDEKSPVEEPAPAPPVAPQVAPAAQQTRPIERPQHPKKDSLIHYPTPEEAEREVKEEGMAPAKLTAPTPLSALAAVASSTPPVTPRASGPELGAAAAARPAQAAPSSPPGGKPRPAKKRSLIHYPTREEVEREAKDETAAQSGTVGKKERSWVTRAWTGFFGH